MIFPVCNSGENINGFRQKYYHNYLAEKAWAVKYKPHGTQHQSLKQNGLSGSSYNGESEDSPG